MTASTQSPYITCSNGALVKVDPDVYERATAYNWISDGHSYTAHVDGKMMTMGRFVTGHQPRGTIIKRIDTARHQNGIGEYVDFTRANLQIVTPKQSSAARPLGQVRGIARSHPRPVAPTPAQAEMTVTPPPPAAPGPQLRPRFIDLTGKGMIVNVDDIAAIDLTDPDVVTVERRTQQWNQAGRDTCAITYIYEGEDARFVRAWAEALADSGGLALIHEVMDLRTRLNGTNTAIERAYKAEADLEKLRTKLRAIGFDVNRLLSE